MNRTDNRNWKLLSMIGETDGSYIKYVHFFGGYMEEISYLCYVNNNTESNGDKL